MADPAGAAGRLPDFLIIGAAKSGTSTLYRHLRRHPRIYMSPVKEPCFFDPDATWRRGVDWYRSLFAGATADQLCGEASTNYTRYPQVRGVPERIARLIPDVKLVYIMRHPVERAYSHFVHRHTKEIRPGRPFETSFEAFVRTDPMCLDGSDYRLQIEQYLAHFPREALQLLLLEDLEADPLAVLRELLGFLGVDDAGALAEEAPIVAVRAADHRDRQVYARIMDPLRRNAALRALAWAIPRPARRRAYELLRRTRHGRAIEAAYEPPPMRAETRAHLIERYRDSNRWVGELIGRDLSHWNR
jgi:hypothetical protein